ncbi:MAG: response regulator [Hyphomicrobiales bacterium]|nr:response regulator [Hyphomicrobiales bacterium]
MNIRQEDRRTAPRQIVERGGIISFEDGEATLPCMVRDLSKKGARLHVSSVHHVPDTFTLNMEIYQVEVQGIVVWRSETEVGVLFQSQPKRTAIDPACNDGTTTSQSGRPNRNPIPILIAEDDPDDRLLIQEAFNESNFDHPLDFVTNGEELLQYLDAQGKFKGSRKPGLILLDLNMPKMDGREALKHIKANSATRRIPIVVFTTSNSEDDIDSTYELGVSSYISKPSSVEGLKEVVNTLNGYWSNLVALPTSR